MIVCLPSPDIAMKEVVKPTQPVVVLIDGCISMCQITVSSIASDTVFVTG